MSMSLTRRHFAIGAASLPALGSPAAFAQQKVMLTGVQWGGQWVEAARKITATDGRWGVNWELHAGGAATVIPKIRAAWPRPLYDFVAQWSLLYPVWAEQDWPEPLTVAEMPVLKELPEEIFYRNERGEIINLPLSLTASVWGYREDIMPVEVKTVEDLLNPKLKGKILIRDAVAGNGLVVHLATAFGGGEKNMEPGWDFLKRLARSGNIGRVASTEADFINSLTSGECAIGLFNTGAWRAVSQNFPCKFIILDKAQSPGFQVGLHNEGYVIPKNSTKKDDVKRYLNWFLNAQNNTEYNKAIGALPVNLGSETSEFAKQFLFSDAEKRRRLVHVYDFGILAREQTQMIARFQAEIIPLLR